MSSQNTQTTYTYLGYSQLGAVGDFAVVVTAQTGFGDTEAAALFDALRAAFPAALEVGLSVTKTQVVQTNFDTSSTTPPTFS